MTMEQIASNLQLFMWIAVIAFVAIGVLKGRSRGIFRQLIRTATIVIAFLLSITVTKSVYNSVTANINENGGKGLVSTLETSYGISLGNFSDIMVKLDASTINLVVAIPMSLIVLPFVFVTSFIMLKGVLRIVHALVCKVFGFAKWRNNFLTRLLGAALGAIQGFMVAVIIFSPVCGLTTNLSDAVTKFENEQTSSVDNEDVKKIYDKYITPLTKNSCATMLGAMGGNAIYNMITTLEVNGTSYNIPEELTEPTLRLAGAIASMENFDFANMTDENKSALNTIIDVAKDSPYMATLFAEMLDIIATEAQDKTHVGDSALAGSLKGILSVFVDIESENVAPTLELVRDILFLTTINYNDLSDVNRAAFDTLIDSAREDDYKAEVLAVILDAIATDINSQPEAENDLNGNLIRTFFTVFVDIPKEDVVPTLEVVRDAIFILDDAEVISALGQDPALLSTKFSEKDASGQSLISKLTEKFDSHDRTRPLISSITKLSITIMAESMPKVEGVEITDETYTNVKDSVNNGIVDINQKYDGVDLVEGTTEYEEYVSEVSDTLSNTFVENGINVDKPVADEMAKYIAENHKDQTQELSDAEINNIILSYYDAYLQSQNAQNPENP